ncbi:hypothetical protein SDC9_45165 [bioreactor metagenome]|uniref:Uncharacterized protein n=1 Tax=bioreactor metagenome TaxID=1076179 RepID=A0A644W942_9ZZZZ
MQIGAQEIGGILSGAKPLGRRGGPGQAGDGGRARQRLDGAGKGGVEADQREAAAGEPVRQEPGAHPRLDHRRPGRGARRKARIVGQHRRAFGIGEGRHLPRVGELAREGVGEGEAKRRVAQDLPAAGGRRHEARAFRGIRKDIKRRAAPLGGVAVNQRHPGLAGQHMAELPADVMGVGDAVVQPAHAEDRHDMGTVADEDHRALAVVLERQRVGRIDRPPFKLPRARMADLGQHRGDAVAHDVLAHCLGRVLVIAKLIVDAPDVVGLAVNEHRRAGPAGRVEKRAADRRIVVLHLHVGDDIAALEILPLQAQAKLAAHRAARPVGGQNPTGVEAVASLGIGDGQPRAGLVDLDPLEPALPARLDQRVGLDRLPQIGLDELLLEVVHRAEFLFRPVGHVELEDLPAAVEAAPRGPAERLLEEGRDHAEAVEDGIALPRDADRPAAIVEAVLRLDQHRGDALLGKRQRRDHADGAGADDGDGHVARKSRARRALGRRELRIGEIKRCGVRAACRSHAVLPETVSRPCLPRRGGRVCPSKQGTGGDG